MKKLKLGLVVYMRNLSLDSSGPSRYEGYPGFSSVILPKMLVPARQKQTANISMKPFPGRFTCLTDRSRKLKSHLNFAISFRLSYRVGGVTVICLLLSFFLKVYWDERQARFINPSHEIAANAVSNVALKLAGQRLLFHLF